MAKPRSRWLAQHYYVIVAVVGVVLIVLAAPVGQFYAPTSEELNKAFENDVNGIEDCTDILAVRYRAVGVFLGLLYLGFAHLVAAVGLFSGSQIWALFNR